MKPEDLAKLTPEEKRIRIAELRGWVRHDGESGPWGGYRWYHNGKAQWCEAPDYVNDLNAMHEAENRIGPKQKRKYGEMLDALTRSQHSTQWKIIHATAAQRADVFLLTLG